MLIPRKPEVIGTDVEHDADIGFIEAESCAEYSAARGLEHRDSTVGFDRMMLRRNGPVMSPSMTMRFRDKCRRSS